MEAVKAESWDSVIGSEKGLFDINFKELWRYRDLILLFVRRDFVASYKQTILGPIWFFITPLFTTFTFVVIFSKVAKLSTDGIPPVLFYLSGITFWAYFADCLTKTSNTFTSNANIFGKVYFPRLSIPISIIISSLIKFGIQLLLLVFLVLYYAISAPAFLHLNGAILLVPFLVFIMALLGLGLGLIFSAFTTKYKDLSFLLQFGIQLLMYATPVIYPLSSTGGKLKMVLQLNPLSSIIETFRFSLFGVGHFSWLHLGYSFGFSVVVLFLGVVLFNQVEKSFMDTV